MTESQKLDRLDAYLDANHLESVWLASPPLFAWLTGGSNLVARTGEAGVAAVGYDGSNVTVLTSTIEAERLRDEEVDGDVTVESFPWYEQDLESAVGERAAVPAAADISIPGFERLERSALTHPLTDNDAERYHDAGRETAAAVEAVARNAKPTDTERSLAARLFHALEARGVGSPVVLVGGEDRVQWYRHFTPKEVEVGGYAVLTVVGVSQGKHVAVTRTVAFEDAPDWLEDRYADTCRVTVTAAAATREAGRTGGTAADILDAIGTAYDELGYDDEWENHHQGGALGYAPREWVATPHNETSVELPVAAGWNPTVPGAKSEETLLVRDSAVEVVTDTGEVPRRTVSAVGYDFELSVPELLTR